MLAGMELEVEVGGGKGDGPVTEVEHPGGLIAEHQTGADDGVRAPETAPGTSNDNSLVTRIDQPARRARVKLLGRKNREVKEVGGGGRRGDGS